MTSREDAEVRAALVRAANFQRRQFKLLQSLSPKGPAPRIQAEPSPEHYHLIYNVPKDGISIPHFQELYVTSREGYQKIHEMAREAEPNVEWYEDGQVGFETRLHGRTDQWWIVLEVAACIRSTCGKTLARKDQKRKLILLPGERE